MREKRLHVIVDIVQVKIQVKLFNARNATITKESLSEAPEEWEMRNK